MSRALLAAALVAGLAACFPQAPRDASSPASRPRSWSGHVSSSPSVRSASAAGAEPADLVRDSPNARPAAWLRLPAPNRLSVESPPPPLAEPLDLRALVGRRDERDPTRAALAWSRVLGPPAVPALRDAMTGADVVSIADGGGRLSPPAEPAQPGDLLVFDRTDSDRPADLVALVVARDARGVTEFVYLGGGVVRRGFYDVAHPARRRDSHGAILNTSMRTGRRWPPKGTHYLAAELLAHVIHMR